VLVVRPRTDPANPPPVPPPSEELHWSVPLIVSGVPSYQLPSGDGPASRSQLLLS
jgi:hypothetical protein